MECSIRIYTIEMDFEPLIVVYTIVGAFTSPGAWRILSKNSNKIELLLSRRCLRSSQLSRHSWWVFPSSGLQYSPIPYGSI